MPLDMYACMHAIVWCVVVVCVCVCGGWWHGGGGDGVWCVYIYTPLNANLTIS